MNKPESFEICFIPDNNYERFLRERVPDVDKRFESGEITKDGQVIGTHRGIPFYTIGQRKGIGIAMAEPLYVTRIDKERNRIEVGHEEKLYHRGLVASRINLMKHPDIREPLRVTAKVRYKDTGGLATVTAIDHDRIQVMFDEPRRAITPGQSVVIYEDDDVVGGAIIDVVID
jgi:tRNA-specific 2-thiouridylase